MRFHPNQVIYAVEGTGNVNWFEGQIARANYGLSTDRMGWHNGFGMHGSAQKNREYEFDIDKLAVQRTIDNKSKQFSFKAAVVDSVNTVLIQAIPPYGPQKDYDVKDTLQLGSLTEKNIKTNWK